MDNNNFDPIKLNLDVPLETPVLYIVFKRLDMVEQSLEAIRKARPSRLYVASDGPRENNEEENASVQSVRKYIRDNIDWNCQVKALFMEKNVGCNLNVTNALNWFFDNEEAGIIIEDDILPDVSFFYFCQTLLNYYKNDERIMFIGGMGDKKDPENINISGNYHFVKTFNVWGWASWRRVWQKFDFDCKYLDYFLENRIMFKVIHNADSLNHFWRMFKFILKYRAENDINAVSWDFSVAYMMFINNGLTALPNFNLVSNIGHGHKEGAYSKNEKYFIEKKHSINEIIHPKLIYPEDDFNDRISSLVLELEENKLLVHRLREVINELKKTRPK